jgi:hypothetical protein
VIRGQSFVEAWIVGQESGRYSYSESTDWGTGKSGMYSDKTDVKFDDFRAIHGAARDPKILRLAGSAHTALSSGVLSVDSRVQGGVAVVEGFRGTTYTVHP